MRVLIVGCGYVGVSLAAELARQGHEVFGLRRGAGAEPELAAAGARLVTADVTNRADLERLPGPFDWVVNCASAGGGGVEDYRRIYLEGNRNLVAALAGTPLKKFVYTSSTGVYGQNDGAVVKETHPTEPASETGQVLVEAEKLLIEAQKQSRFPAVVLRVAGIYGPGRGRYLREFMKNEARMEGQGERWMNMIHREDVAGVIIAALRGARAGEVFNAVDDEPVTQGTFLRWLAEELGKWPPPSVPADAEAQRKRGVTNKRVSNRKLKMELGYAFKFPNFRPGYSAEVQRLAEAGELNIEPDPR